MGIRAVLLAVLSWPAVGAAQGDAKMLVNEAVEHYEAGRYAEAVQAFEAAYRLTHKPAILFNIARAESKLGHEEAAIAFLKRYLEELPGADDASSVRAEVDAREKALAESRAKVRAEAEARHAAQQIAESEARARDSARVEAALSSARAARLARVRKAGIVLLGAGVVLADAHTGEQGSFRDCCLELDQRGRVTMGFGIALDVLGGAAAVGGVALLGWSARK